jgi:hypothetical protein
VTSPEQRPARAERRDPPLHPKAPDKADNFAKLATALLDGQHTPEQEAKAADKEGSFANLRRALLDEEKKSLDGSKKHKSVFGGIITRLLFVLIIVGIGIGAYAYSTGSIQLTFLRRFF